MAAVAASMAQRTGKTLDDWVALVLDSDVAVADQKAVRTWLRDVHGLKQNSQWTIAQAAAEKAGIQLPRLDDYVDQQFAGKKAGLRPIFEAIEAAVATLEATTMEGRAGYLPFVHHRQFAAAKAATSTRLDLGFRFVEAPESSRLSTASPIGQCTHKVGLTTPDDVDAEVLEWLKRAHEQN